MYTYTQTHTQKLGQIEVIKTKASHLHLNCQNTKKKYYIHTFECELRDSHSTHTKQNKSWHVKQKTRKSMSVDDSKFRNISKTSTHKLKMENYRICSVLPTASAK